MPERTIPLVALLGLALISARAVANETPAPIHQVEGVSEYRLDNGLKILLIPDSSVSTLTSNVILRIGSRHEVYGETGLAHLLEHLQFKGTPAYPNFIDTITKYGWSAKATTWYDHTCYLKTMEGTEENLERVVQFEADRLTNNPLLPVYLQQEMPIVRNELENSRNTPWGFLPPRLRSVSLQWHNYGKATIGNRADLEQMPLERIRSFYRKYYQPDNVTLLLAGRMDEQKALAAIKKHWEPIPKPTRQLPPEITREPASDGEQLVTIRRVGGVPMAGVHYRIPAGSHADFAALHVLARLLMGGKPGELWEYEQAGTRGRLHQSLVAEGPATSAFGSISGLRDLGFLEFYGLCASESDARAALDRLIETVEDKEATFTDRDVRNAKNSLVRNIEETIIDLPKLAEQLTYREASGDWRLFYLQRDRLQNVTPADIQRVANKYLRRSNRTAGIYLPESKRSRVDIPPPPDLAALLDNYQSDEPVVRGEYIEPDPKLVESRIIRRTLPIGTKLVLLPKGTRGERLRFSLTLRYGDSETLSNRRAAALILPKLIASSEAKRKAREGIRGTFGSMSISSDGDPGVLKLTARCERRYLERVMAQLTNLVRSPDFSADAFDDLKRVHLLGLRAAQSSTFDLADRAVRRHEQPYHRSDPRYVPTHLEAIEDLQALEIGDVRDLWQELLGASHATFVAVGSFDPDEMIGHVDQLTGAWNSPCRFEPLTQIMPSHPKGRPIHITVPEKESAAMAGDLPIKISPDREDYAALLVAKDILLVSRLYPRVNQEEGLSYTPRFGFKTLNHSNFSQFTLRLSCNVQRAGELERAVREEFESIRESPYTAAEFAAAIGRHRHQLRHRIATDQRMFRSLERLAEESKTLESLVKERAAVEALSLADVQRAAERHLDYTKMQIAIAGARD